MGKAKDAKAKTKKAAASSSSGSKGDAAAPKPAKDKGKKGKSGSSSGLFYGDPLERELAAVGLRVAKITADGNCLFRAVCDQVEGDEAGHADLRQRACDLMVERREDFEPFMEDDESFDNYIKRMRKDGVWGGAHELQALSLLAGANVFVYQEGQPRWTVRNHPDSAPSIHISYHGGEHYNSVRLLDDYSRGPPRPIVLAEGGATAAELAKERAAWSPADEARVAANTGCDSPALVQRALREAGGDVDGAIERVIEAMAGNGGGGEEGDDAAAAELGKSAAGAAPAEDAAQPGAAAAGAESAEGGGPCGGSSSGDAAGGPAAASEAGGGAAGEAAPEGAASFGGDAGAGNAGGAATAAAPSKPAKPRAKRGVEVGGGPSVSVGKKPARNKGCPCGSGKKWKSCCGAAAAAAERRQRALREQAEGAAGGGALPAMLATLAI